VNLVAEKVGPGEVARAAEQGIDLAPFDEAWARVAAEAPHQTLAVAVQAFEDALDPDGPEPDPTEGRRLSIAKHTDGSICVGCMPTSVSNWAAAQSSAASGNVRLRAAIRFAVGHTQIRLSRVAMLGACAKG
jgi:hypothetical protein